MKIKINGLICGQIVPLAYCRHLRERVCGGRRLGERSLHQRSLHTHANRVVQSSVWVNMDGCQWVWREKERSFRCSHSGSGRH